ARAWMPILRSFRWASCAASAALSTQVKTPRFPDEPPQPQPQSFLAGAGADATWPLDAARRETTDSTTERSISGSRVFMRDEEIANQGMKRPQGISAAFVYGFTEDLDAVDDRHDGGIDRDLLEPLRGAGGTALAEEHEL